MPLITKESSPYFYKAKHYYRLAWYAILWIILYTQITKPLNINAIVAAVLLVVPALALYIIVPIGIFSIYKSFKNKEPYNKYRTFYLIGHSFFLFILIALLVSICLDINRFSMMK